MLKRNQTFLRDLRRHELAGTKVKIFEKNSVSRKNWFRLKSWIFVVSSMGVTTALKAQNTP